MKSLHVYLWQVKVDWERPTVPILWKGAIFECEAFPKQVYGAILHYQSWHVTLLKSTPWPLYSADGGCLWSTITSFFVLNSCTASPWWRRNKYKKGLSVQQMSVPLLLDEHAWVHAGHGVCGLELSWTRIENWLYPKFVLEVFHIQSFPFHRKGTMDFSLLFTTINLKLEVTVNLVAINCAVLAFPIPQIVLHFSISNIYIT